MWSNHHPTAVSNNVTNTQKDSVATCQGDFFTQYGDINTTRTVTVNGVENLLFCEYIDPSLALNNLKTTERASLGEIATNYHLTELSATNWEEYDYTFGGRGTYARVRR